MSRLKGKVAIITGAAQGIGATYAQALAAEGAKVVLCDLKAPDDTAAAIRNKGGTALAIACDVTDGAAVQAMVEEAVAQFSGVHVLINNAALFATLELKPFEQTSSAEWDRIMAVNVRGSFECAKAVMPVMRRQGYGKIVNIASATAFKGAPMMAAYVASKGAVIALTRSIAREVGDAGIRCNCLAPGLTMSANVQANGRLGRGYRAQQHCQPLHQARSGAAGSDRRAAVSVQHRQ
ncbi:SDR family NAD(P)-dependent oxidoreductase [Pseudomonas sp. VI4.1]|uniref:SDR family NAD(P)-dependent oxidoreductase n=1 Tax=Pseudomonas sp. VI4.1 TaxID=1941346 RepID=UPI0021146F4D|nr:SDR family NAD(P)-dependent oxidoreductase [Pseudomonas sp. VI4.1]